MTEPSAEAVERAAQAMAEHDGYVWTGDADTFGPLASRGYWRALAEVGLRSASKATERRDENEPTDNQLKDAPV